MIAGPVQFFTTGSGGWRRLLAAGRRRDLYVQLYPNGRRWSVLPVPMLEVCQDWVECDVARAGTEATYPEINFRPPFGSKSIVKISGGGQ